MAVHEALLDRYVGDDELVVDAAWATWDLSVFSVRHGDASGVVAVPRARLEEFLDDLWAGGLDERLKTDIRSRRVQRRRLASGDEATGVAVYGGVTDPGRLAPRERDPWTGRVQPPGGPRGRNAKRRSDDMQPRPKLRRFSTRAIVAGAVVGGVVVVGSAMALSGGKDETPVVATGPTSTSLFVDDRPATNQQLSYQVTVTVTSFETDEFTEHPSSTFSVGWYCGSYRVMDDGTEYPECSPDPRDAWAYFAPDFELPDPIRRSFHSERPLPKCTPGVDDHSGPGMIIDVNGYGSDTISGTYEAGYGFIKCALDASGDTQTGGYAIGYHLTGTFTGRLVDELVPVTTTSTTYPSGPAEPGSQEPAGPVVGRM